MSIGVAITTTYSRPEFLGEAVASWRRAEVEPIVVGLGLSAVVLVAATLASPPAAASVTLPERQEAS